MSMINGKYTISIEDVPGKRLVGNWMHLNAEADKDERLGLWRAFARRVKGVANLEGGVGYGLCVNMRDNLDCDYWTAVEAGPETPMPVGMVPVNLTGGRYVSLSANSGTTAAECFDYLFNSWEKEQGEYKLDRSGPCFEVLESNWDKRGTVKVFVPCK